ncbi:hypothetical protein CERSUDRAFT_85365 [Gelatoporia subvermispora B]|uniref:Uncharacterized protein n=1 Tax=Ceriporiopsis subvermispora (strain B) TaxID=914234 RepID=M2QE82_CERS8|nr:hypothetical protein CERSUDRAFT_85365 [Gelatoporia subvermispora B]
MTPKYVVRGAQLVRSLNGQVARLLSLAVSYRAVGSGAAGGRLNFERRISLQALDCSMSGARYAFHEKGLLM